MSKVYGMSTRNDAEILLLEAMNGEFADIEAMEVEFFVDQILTECYDEIGHWDIQDVNTDIFWDIVRNNHIYKA